MLATMICSLICSLYEDDELLAQQPAERDRLFNRGATVGTRYRRYQPGFSSRSYQPEASEANAAWWRAPLGGYGHDKPAYYDDESLARMVKASIAADPHIPANVKEAVAVSVKGGRVILSGVVPSAKLRTRVASAASWTQGVNELTNLLEVRS
jgi:hypothetical protein